MSDQTKQTVQQVEVVQTHPVTVNGTVGISSSDEAMRAIQLTITVFVAIFALEDIGKLVWHVAATSGVIADAIKAGTLPAMPPNWVIWILGLAVIRLVVKIIF